MTITRLLTSTAVVAALAFNAAPAFAQHRGGGRSAGRSASGSGSGHATSSPRVGPSVQSAPSRSGGAPSRVQSAPSRSGGARIVGSAVPRTGGFVRTQPRVIGGSRGFSGGFFSRPYYTFRPRLSLGFGFSVGYPVVYPYYGAYASPYGYYDPYYDPYAYSAPYPGYGNPAYSAPPQYGTSGTYNAPSQYGNSGTYNTPPNAQGSIGVQPGAATGGLSFEMSPGNAEVFVDGNDYGVVSNFTPNSQPLSLAPGRHRVELRAPGYEPMMFDADVIAGQVIPYQGTLQTMRR